MSALVLGFYWPSIQEVLTTWERWLTVVCPCLTRSSWTREVSQFRDRRSGEQNTSSSGNIGCIRHLILKPTVLDGKWYCHCSLVWPCVLFLCPVSRVEYVFPQHLPIFNDLFSLVSHRWKASSLLWFEPCSASSRWAKVSWVLVPKSILWWSLTIDLQWDRDHWNSMMLLGNDSQSFSLLALLICPDLFPYRAYTHTHTLFWLLPCMLTYVHLWLKRTTTQLSFSTTSLAKLWLVVCGWKRKPSPVLFFLSVLLCRNTTSQ